MIHDEVGWLFTLYFSCKTTLFGYAGTKDARAITVQTLTMKSVKPGRIIMAQEELQKSGIYIGDFKYVIILRIKIENDFCI